MRAWEDFPCLVGWPDFFCKPCTVHVNTLSPIANREKLFLVCSYLTHTLVNSVAFKCGLAFDLLSFPGVHFLNNLNRSLGLTMQTLSIFASANFAFLLGLFTKQSLTSTNYLLPYSKFACAIQIADLTLPVNCKVVILLCLWAEILMEGWTQERVV